MIQSDSSQTENTLGQPSRCTGDWKKSESTKSKVSDSKTVSVLVVEDNPADARLIREMLAQARRTQFNVVCVDRLSTALDRIRKEKIDAVLLDLSLPDSRGVGTFVKMLVTAPWVPVVVFSGLDDEETALQAVQRGAQDYLVKGQIDSHSLVRAIRYSTERKRAEEQIRELNQTLERRVLERSAAQAEAIRELDAFNHLVARDLRSPLRAIGGFAELLIAQYGLKLDPEAQHYLQRIQESAQRMGRVVDDLLLLGRMSGKR